MRDFKSYLTPVRRAQPASVNLALAGVDHFYRYLGAGRPDLRREELAQAPPRALSPDELRRFCARSSAASHDDGATLRPTGRTLATFRIDGEFDTLRGPRVELERDRRGADLTDVLLTMVHCT